MSQIRVAHVLVGAGLVGYMHNALTSVINAVSSRPGDKLLVIYNAVSKGDFEDFHRQLASAEWPDFIEIRVQQNGLTRRTGSLYSAYNWALGRIDKDFELVNFMQSDMQMLRFPESVATFASQNLGKSIGTERLLCLSNQFPVLGREVESFDRRMKNIHPGFWVSQDNAVTDSGLYSVRLLRELGFRFEGTESSLSNKWLKAGFRFGLATPFMAALPFPSAVRPGNRIVGVAGKKIESTPLLLARESEPWEGATSPVWLEQVVTPSQGRIPYPYWVTDFRNPEWLRRRLAATRHLGTGFFSSIDPQGKVRNSLAIEMAPQLWSLVLDSVRYRVFRRLGLTRLLTSAFRALDRLRRLIDRTGRFRKSLQNFWNVFPSEKRRKDPGHRV